MTTKRSPRASSLPSAARHCNDGPVESGEERFVRTGGIEPLDPAWWDGDSIEAEVAEPSLRSISTRKAGVVVTLASRRGFAAPPVPRQAQPATPVRHRSV